MANLLDYVRWRGDIPLTSDNFNEIDALALSTAVYVKWGGIIPAIGEGEFTTFEDAVPFVGDKYANEEMPLSTMFTDRIHFLIEAMARSVRFKDLHVMNYICINDRDMDQQFEAYTVEIDKKSAVIVFAGTDRSFAGWKENFMMSFRDSVPAQESATEYVNKVGKRYKRLWLCGHSKGGNLSIYSGSMCSIRIQNKIEKVYNFDCPGFREQFFKRPEYLMIRNRVQSFYPAVSFVGMLMVHDEKYNVVDTSVDTIVAHNAFNWKVEGTKILCLESLKGKGAYYDIVSDEWLKSLTDDEKEEFVTSFFQLMEDAGVETTNDLWNLKVDNLMGFIKGFAKLDGKRKKNVFKVLLNLLGAGSKYRYVLNTPNKKRK